MSCGLSAALQWAKYIGLMQFKDTLILEEDEDKSTAVAEQCARVDFSSLESKLNYKFKRPRQLLQAFTHASYFAFDKAKPFWERNESQLKGSLESYQKLEYLGNGVADYMVSKYLYTKYPHADPCLLHKLKICCLNNQLFCVIAVDLGLEKYMQASKKLRNELETYKSCLAALRYSFAGSDKPIDTDELDHCFVKVLSDVLEAVMGAVMCELQDFGAAEKVFLPILAPYFEAYATPATFKEHPKSILYEMVNREKGEMKSMKWRKVNKEDREGFNAVVYKGWLADALVAQAKFRHESYITEKKFFRKMLKNVEGILAEYHKRSFPA